MARFVHHHAFTVPATAIALLVLPCGIVAQHVVADRPRIVLAICNAATVTASAMSQARQTATSVFERARIRIEWVPCGNAAAQERDAALAVQVLLVADAQSASRAVPPRTLGMVVRGEDAAEGIWVLTSRIMREADAQHVDVGCVLGSVIAHEIGHLLLPRGRHSDSGLMVVAWAHDDFVRASQGTLQFAASDAMRLRASLRDRQQVSEAVAARVH